MAIVTEIRNTVTDTTPVFAVVGATDLAVEKVREARTKAAAARADLDVKALPSKAVERASKMATRVTEQAQHVAEQAQQVPVLTLNRTLEIAGRAQESYGELADRGEKLVKRLRSQKSTQDLIASANETVARGKGAVTTARKAAIDTQRAAKATLTTGRHELEKAVDTVTTSAHDKVEAVAESIQDEAQTVAASIQDEAQTVADSVQDEVEAAGTTVRESAANTRTAARRATTTAKNRAASTKAATKSAATEASKTVTSAAKATKTAAAKIGD